MKQYSLNDISQKIVEISFISSLFEGDTLSLCVEYISEFPNAKLLRELIDVLGLYVGMSPKWRTRLVLIVDELNNNAIEYGSKQGDTNKIFISIIKAQDGTEVAISVQDTGNGAHAKTASDMKKIQDMYKNINYQEHDSIRGRGLFLIISKLVDSLTFEDAPSGGLKVSFFKKILVSDS